MIDLSEVVVLDVEASGLHDGSYPIEVGFARPLPDLPGRARLISPPESWGEDMWSPASESIHNISREMLFEYGSDVKAVAEMLNDELCESIVYSDATEWDALWIRELYRAAGMRMRFILEPVEELFLDIAQEANLMINDYVDLRGRIEASVSVLYPHIHRAEADARAMAAICRGLAVPSFREQMERDVAALVDAQWEEFADR